MNKDFEDKKYCVVPSGLSEETIALVTQYALFDESQSYAPEREDQQVPGAHSKYGDPMMESLLLHLQPTIEKHTGLSLYPTYSYYRVYHPGDELKHHVDRPACEISLTISFEFDFKDTLSAWPIYIDGAPIELKPGEMAIYKGIELDHWREKLEAPEGSWHVQAFLHYVDVNGPHADQKWDARPSIGVLPEKTRADQSSATSKASTTKSYITYTQ
jgi:hypothetical protein